MKKTVPVTMRLTPLEKQKLEEIAERLGLSKTGVVCMLVNKEWEKQNEKKKRCSPAPSNRAVHEPGYAEMDGVRRHFCVTER